MLKNFYTSDTKGKLFMLAVEFYIKCILAKNQCNGYNRYLFLKAAESNMSELLWPKSNWLNSTRMPCAVVIGNISLSIL